MPKVPTQSTDLERRRRRELRNTGWEAGCQAGGERGEGTEAQEGVTSTWYKGRTEYESGTGQAYQTITRGPARAHPAGRHCTHTSALLNPGPPEDMDISSAPTHRSHSQSTQAADAAALWVSTETLSAPASPTWSKTSGLRWISLRWLVHIPWAHRTWDLPVLTALASL